MRGSSWKWLLVLKLDNSCHEEFAKHVPKRPAVKKPAALQTLSNFDAPTSTCRAVIEPATSVVALMRHSGSSSACAHPQTARATLTMRFCHCCKRGRIAHRRDEIGAPRVLQGPGVL